MLRLLMSAPGSIPATPSPHPGDASTGGTQHPEHPCPIRGSAAPGEPPAATVGEEKSRGEAEPEKKQPC